MVALEQPFQEFHGDTCKSVAVGNHNFLDSSATDGVQKGEKMRAFPVEPTPRVTEEFVRRIGSGEVGALSFEIRFLVGGTDAGVAKATACSRFLGRDDGVPKDARDVANGVVAVPGLAVAADGGDDDDDDDDHDWIALSVSRARMVWG